MTVFMTECDFEREKRCFEERAKLLQCLKSYTEYTRQFFVECREDAKSLWKMSVKYNILIDACPKGIYPAQITDQVICELLAAKRKILRKLKRTITTWTIERYAELTDLYMNFLRSTKVLKWISPNPFMVGGPHEKPIKFYMDGTLDATIYFHSLHKQVESQFMAISLEDTESIVRFEKRLCFSTQFEDILNDLLMFSRLLM